MVNWYPKYNGSRNFRKFFLTPPVSAVKIRDTNG